MNDEDPFEDLVERWQREANRRTPLNLMVKWSKADERALIEDRPRARSVFWRSTALLLVWCIAALVFTMTPAWGTGWMLVRIPAGLIMGALAARGALSTQQRMIAYRTGWSQGRTDMLSSLTQAREAGEDLDDWMLRVTMDDFQHYR